MSADHSTGTRSGPSQLWSFREDVEVEFTSGNGAARLASRWGEVTIERPSGAVREALHRMRLGPIALENVFMPGVGPDGKDDDRLQWVQLYSVLDRLQPFIIRTLGDQDAQPLISVAPLTPRARFHPMPMPPGTPVRLSVFAELRTDGREFRLESPLSLHRVLLHQPAAVALIGTLGRPVTVAASVEAWPQLGPVASDLLSYLAAVGMVVFEPDSREESSMVPVVAPEDAELVGWSPVDLMFHARSTGGRTDDRIGVTYPLGAGGSPEPVVMRRRAEPGIALHRPRWEEVSATDPRLLVAMEGRRSVRHYGDEPVTARELGELLYRTARVRALITPPGGPPRPGELDPRISDRPYPGGGACYELELYVTVNHCLDIPPGIYHYDPLDHRLEPVNTDLRAVRILLADARQIADLEEPPPLLITMTARYRRLSWKYQGITYATVLKDVGALFQSLYLICTAMRLAPCALGYVHAEATAHALGTDWRLEPSVGQFIVGRAPEALPRYGWSREPVNDDDWSDRARAHLAG